METEKSYICGSGASNGTPVEYVRRLRIVGKRRVNNCWMADCICSCGTHKTVRMSALSSGSIVSCGCLKRERGRLNGLANTRHGHASPHTRSRTYRSWESMKARCFNTTHPSYNNYGARGVTVCTEWLQFDNFLKDMGIRPANTSLDRIDTYGNYCSSNCRWATRVTQGRNRRVNRLIQYDGALVPLVVVAERTKISYGLLFDRIVRYGWDVERAITTPINVAKRNRKGHIHG